MKLRHPWLIQSTALTSSLALRFWSRSLDYTYHGLGEDLEVSNPPRGNPSIYCFWHEDLLTPTIRYPGSKIAILISQHADGELIAKIGEAFGYKSIRGSSTRGGAEALRELMRQGRDLHLVVTPDGPRGPRREVQPGLIFLAAQTGMPIVTCGFGYQSAWRLKSWDRFVVPRPGSRVAAVTSKKIVVPRHLKRQGLQQYADLVRDELLENGRIAQQMVDGETRQQAA